MPDINAEERKRRRFASDEQPKVMVRLPQDLKDELWEQAERDMRGLNGEIVYLLTIAVKQNRQGGGRRLTDRGGRRTSDQNSDQQSAA